jgi:23S rRNA (uracil1939-C5)-methyltransferase
MIVITTIATTAAVRDLTVPSFFIVTISLRLFSSKSYYTKPFQPLQRQSTMDVPKDGAAPETDELTIESIVAGGDGLARRPDGCVVFVPRTAPGERVSVRYTEMHRQWRRARATRLVERSPDRRDPPCPHYTGCGGCQLQHLGYDAQLAAKASIVEDALRRLGGLDPPPIEIVPSPRELGYRNRVSMVLRRGDRGVQAGYHGAHDKHEVIDVDSCPLAESPINRVWAALREAWAPAAAALPRGRELRLTLRADAEGRVGLAIEGGRGVGDIAGLVERVAGLDAVWLVNQRDQVIGRAGAPVLIESVGPYEIPLAGTAFVQVNRSAAELMETYVREQCGDVENKRVVDAYCGFGTRALELAREDADVVGIDHNRHSIGAASRGARESGASARFVAGRVERRIGPELPADVVILNPPRNGVAGAVADALLEHSVPRVVYVSCDPATLARDLKRLSPRYELRACRAFDLFPQTAHAETVVTLDRAIPDTQGTLQSQHP